MCCTYTLESQCAICQQTYKLYIIVKCAKFTKGCTSDDTYEEDIKQGYEEFYPFQQLGLYHNCPRCAYEQSGLSHPQTGQPLTWPQFLLKGFVSTFEVNGVTNHSCRTFTEDEFATAEATESAGDPSGTADTPDSEIRASEAVDVMATSSGAEDSSVDGEVMGRDSSEGDDRKDWQASGMSYDY